MTSRKSTGLALALLAGSLARLVSAQVIEVTRFTIDNGGVMHSTGGDLELSGTIGQSDAGVLTGGAFTLTGGFWFPLAPTDCNEDGLANLGDHAAFLQCLNGPLAPGSLGCQCADVDRSGSVDLRDFAAAQVHFTGP